MSNLKPSRTLAGVATMLALVAFSLFLVSLADEEPSVAVAAPLKTELSGTMPERIDTAVYTVYVPLVYQPKQIVPNLWRGQYYDNATLSGAPEYTIDETRVDHNWGSGGPAGLSANNFSVRWTGDWGFETGDYTFFLLHDDGVRLWLDDDLLIDRWIGGPGSQQATVSISTEGLHRLKLEYFEGQGDAYVRLHWRRTDLYPQWQGDYYTEPWVEHGHVGSQTDSAIQFEWGEGCPDLVQPFCDSFSVAWNANPLFEPGTYRIFFYADEGYQLYVDGNKVKEGGWYDGQGGGSQDDGYVLQIGGTEHHQITYNFHDRGTLAEARLWMVYMEHPTWYVEFFDNTSLSGQPVIVDPDGYKIFFDWDLGKPRNAMPSNDNFSIRWTGQRYFHAGCYRFGLFADDGVRLKVDGELLVDQWHTGRAEYYSQVTCLTTGYHEVIVEYYDQAGEAEIRFWWE